MEDSGSVSLHSKRQAGILPNLKSSDFFEGGGVSLCYLDWPQPILLPQPSEFLEL
jgi:hypothetical protein